MQTTTWQIFLVLQTFSYISFSSGTVSLRFSIQEEVPINTTIGSVDAEYYKAKQWHGILNFSIAPQSDLIKLITIDSPKPYYQGRSGWNLRVIGRLDREELCPGDAQPNCPKNFQIIVRGENNFVDFMPAILEVSDINDCSVEFPITQYTLEVHESSPINQIFTLPGAKDCDSATYAIYVLDLEQGQSKTFELVDKYGIDFNPHNNIF